MAARPARADAQNPTPPPPLWPLLCSAVLVGMMIASGVRRAYRTSGTTADRPATGAWDRPQHRRTCCRPTRTSAGVRPGPSRPGAMADTLARLERHPLAHL